MANRSEDYEILHPDRLLDLAFALVISDWDPRRSPLAHSIVPPRECEHGDRHGSLHPDIRIANVLLRGHNWDDRRS
jgi:hypothetical protein